jgi:flagellar protein FliO/FliZ
MSQPATTGVGRIDMLRACLCCLLLCSGLLAGDAAPVFTDQEWTASQPAVRQAPEAPGWGAIGGLVGGLLAVVALAVALGWVAKRLNARRLLGGRGRHMEVVETVNVGPRRSLALVRLGGQWLVVGLGEKELCCIASMPAPPEAQAPAATATPAPAAPSQPSPFAGELARLMGGAKP